MEEWEISDLIEVKNDWKKLAQEQVEKAEEIEKENQMLKGLLKEIYNDGNWHLPVNVTEKIKKIILNEDLPDEWKMRI